jgi:hypothetical protein
MPQRLAALLLALIVSTAVPGFAQVQPSTGVFMPQQQQQVSFDYSGKMMRLTWEFEKQFAILRSYPYLHEARLFQTNDTSYTLEASHIVDGKLERELKTLTVQEVARIRYETSDALRSFAMWGNEERTAVWEDWVLGAGTLGWGLASGISVDAFSASQSSSPWRGQTNVWWIPTLAATGAHIWAANQSWYNRADATMWGNGLLQGTVHGWAIYLLTAPQALQVGDFFLVGTIVGGVEAGAGLALSHFLNLSTAQSHLITSFSSTGLYAGVLAQILTFPTSFAINDLARSVGGTMLACSAAGMWIGAEVGKAPTLTGGDAIVLTTPSNALSATSLVFLNAVRFSSPTPIIAGISIGTSIGGHFLGSLLVQEKDFSFLQGRIINLASGLGGFLPGYFLNNIAIQASFNGQSAQVETLLQISAIAGVIGGIAGFTIPYLMYAKEAEEQHQRRLTATGAQANAGFPRPIPSEQTWLENLAANTDVQFSPLGLLPMLAPAAASVSGFGAVGLPIMSIRTVLGRPAPKTLLDDDNNEFH